MQLEIWDSYDRIIVEGVMISSRPIDEGSLNLDLEIEKP